MATSIHACGATITVGRAFVSGKHRVTVNGALAFEGDLPHGEARQIQAGAREYFVTRRIASGITDAEVICLEITDSGQTIHEGLYDDAGAPVRDIKQARSSAAVKASAWVGAVMGGLALYLIITNVLGWRPGIVSGAIIGAIAGAIGGTIGGAVGWCIGRLVFRSRG